MSISQESIKLQSTKLFYKTDTVEELEVKCLAHMAENRIFFQGSLNVDSQLHRFSIDNKKNQPDEWYVAFSGISCKGNCFLICIYGSWSTQEKYEFKSYDLIKMFDEEERSQLHEVFKRAKEESSLQLKLAQDRVAEECQKLWNDSDSVPLSAAYSLYLQTKNVKSFGIKFGCNPNGYPSIIIPLRNIEGYIRSLQFISMNGAGKSYKAFFSGGEKKGNFHILGKLDATSHIHISEGYSTAATIHEAINSPVIMACDCGNLDSVIAFIRSRYPKNRITICADNDLEAKDQKGKFINPGKIKSEEAAKKYGCDVVFPKFSDDFKLPNGQKPTDFNDLHVHFGLAEVKRQLLSVEQRIDSIVWPEPKEIKATLFPVPNFDSRALLPEALRAWVMDEANRMPCPPEFIAASVLVALGSIVGAQCAIKPKANDPWTIVPNLWGGIVGLPSAKKSPAISVGMKPLDRLISKAMKSLKLSMDTYESEKMVFEAKKGAIEARITAAAKDTKKGNINEIVKELNTHRLDSPQVPTLRRYKSNDTTIQKLGELLRENPAGILVLRDELVGLIASWDQAGREGERSFYLEAWNGNSSFDTDRIGRGSIFIPNLCVSLFGGIQPDKLTLYLEQSANALANDGMLQRFQVLVYPNHRDWEWCDRIPDNNARENAYAVFDLLSEFDPMAWGANPTDDFIKFPYFNFNSFAQQIFIEWAHDLHRVRLPKEDNPLISQHLAKFDKLFPALALIFHLVECATSKNNGSVDEQSATYAVKWCEFLESHARRCYGLLADDGMRSAQALAEKISKSKLTDGFTARDVRRNQWRYLTTETAVEAALDWLEDAEWLRSYKVGGSGPGTGRATFRYSINPKIQKSDDAENNYENI